MVCSWHKAFFLYYIEELKNRFFFHQRAGRKMHIEITICGTWSPKQMRWIFLVTFVNKFHPHIRQPNAYNKYIKVKVYKTLYCFISNSRKLFPLIKNGRSGAEFEHKDLICIIPWSNNEYAIPFYIVNFNIVKKIFTFLIVAGRYWVPCTLIR